MFTSVTQKCKGPRPIVIYVMRADARPLRSQGNSQLQYYTSKIDRSFRAVVNSRNLVAMVNTKKYTLSHGQFIN